MKLKAMDASLKSRKIKRKSSHGKSKLKRKFKLPLRFLLCLAASMSTQAFAEAPSVVIPPNRDTTVVLSRTVPQPPSDGPVLSVLPNGSLNVFGAPAVTMDGGTAIYNAGTIMRNGALPTEPVIEGVPPTFVSTIFIQNLVGGVIQNPIASPADVIGLSTLMDFSASRTVPVTIFNDGTMAGSTIATAPNAQNTLINNGLLTINTITNFDAPAFGTALDSLFFQNNLGGTLNINDGGTISASRTVIFNNAGLIDLVYPSAFNQQPTPPAPGSFTLASLLGSIVFTNTGTIGRLNPVGITPGMGDIIAYNSGFLGTTGIASGIGFYGSTIINTPTGIIQNGIIGDAVIDLSGTMFPSTIVNQGFMQGNLILSSNVPGPTTVNVGGPNATILGNVLSANTLVDNQFNVVDNFTFSGTVSNVKYVNVKAGTFNHQNANNLSNPTAITNFSNFIVSPFAVANLGGQINGNTGATFINYGTVNVNNSFFSVPGGTTNIGRMNINQATTVFGDINNGGILALNGNLTLNSTLTNSGILAVTTPVSFNNGNYVQTSTGAFSTTIFDTVNYGSLNIGGTAFFAPQNQVYVLFGNNFTLANNDGSYFDVLRASSLPAAEAFIVTSNANRLIEVLPTVVGGNTLRLRVRSLALSPNIEGYNEQQLAGALDQLRLAGGRNSLEYIPYLNALRNLPLNEREEALEAMGPDPSYGAGMTSIMQQTTFVNKVTGILDLRRLAGLDMVAHGYSAGDTTRDMMDGRSSISPIYFANGQRQRQFNGVAGYHASTNGIGLLYDTCIVPSFRMGAGVAYIDSNVRAGRIRNKKTNIHSYQGLVYASYDCEQMFFDGVVTLGRNRYNAKQNFGFSIYNFNNVASYSATQASTKFRVGYGIPLFDCAELQPIASIFYTKVRLPQYDLKGASPFTFRMNVRKLEETQGGLGLKFAYTEFMDCFVPEVHVFYLANLQRAKLRSTAHFITAGPGFHVRGPKLPRSGINAGLSLSALLYEDFLLTASYDFEGFKRYQSNSGTIRVRWLF